MLGVSTPPIGFLLAIVVIVFVLVNFPANTYATSANVTGYSQYTGEGFSLQYPKGWIIQQEDVTEYPGGEGILLDNINSQFPEFMNVLLAPETEFMNATQAEIDSQFEQIFPRFVQNMLSIWDTPTELETAVYDRYVLDGHKTGSAVFTANRGELKDLRVLVLGTIIGKNVFSIMYSTPVNVFDQRLPIAENIIKSVKFSEETSVNATTVATPANVTGYSQYTGNRISFQYPADWTILDRTSENAPVDGLFISNDMLPARTFVLAGPSQPEFIEANMTQEEIESRLDLVFPQMLKFVISEIQECTLIELEKPVYDRYMIVGHKAGTAVWSTDCGGIPTTNIMVGNVVGNNAVSLVYNAPEAVFNQNLPIAQNIIDSIRFTANTTGAAEEGQATVVMPANTTGAAEEGQATVVMPLGSSGATSGAGYDPPEITVSPGATVLWNNQDNALHTATSGESPTPDGKFDTGLVGANQDSRPVTMPTEPGEYPYFCTLHPFLTGTVVVE